MTSSATVSLHSRSYELPERPTVIVCIDGFDPEYLEAGITAGILPNMERFIKQGFHTTAKSAMPSLTNPNNVSIITGVPPAVHGIAGNFFLDPETNQEHMILDDTYLRGSTILEQMTMRGVRVAAITAKDKLRRMLQHGLGRSICFSSEHAADCTMEENGIADVEDWLSMKAPNQYSGELSLFVVDAGIQLLEEDRADLFYLTFSDYIQHKYAPGSKESDAFMSAVDERLGRLVELGAIVAVTGDHGMSDKALPDGTPNVLFLEDELSKKFGGGSVRVICPITDPFVRHHGALGSFVRVHFKKTLDVDEVVEFCKSLPGVEVACGRNEASSLFETPTDREGDVVVVSKRDAVIGGRKDGHDLSNLGDHRLRSHGGPSEQDIPLLLSEPVKPGSERRTVWRNFDVFDLALNCVQR